MSAKKIVLIDYENIHPSNLDLLQQHECEIKVFLSATQARMPLDTVRALQVFGEKVEYIQIFGSGPNALDFHIAYYLGRMALEQPDAEYFVISKDTGFDPLMMHVQGKRIRCVRVVSVDQINAAKPFKAKSAAKKKAVASDSSSRLEKVLDNLIKRPTARPRTLKSLRSTVHALFGKKLNETELDQLMGELETRQVIVIADEKFSYGTALTP